MPNLAPSEGLLSKVRAGELTWTEFIRRYKAEMRKNPSLDRRNHSIKNHGQKFTLRLLKKLSMNGTATLMCHCAEDAEKCHRYVLQELVKRA